MGCLMKSKEIYGKITGTGHYVPDNRIYNSYFEDKLDTSDEWIYSRTGIKSRYFSQGEDTSELGTKASLRALKDAGISALDLDGIIFATMTPDKSMPSASCLVQAALGADNAFAFDLVAACSGFVYALTVANQMIENGFAKNILVIGGEVLSKVLDFTDRTTAVLFGDGAGAVVLSASPKEGVVKSYLGAKGDVKDSLFLSGVDFKTPFANKEEGTKLGMDGREIFKFSVRVLGQAMDEVLKDTGYTYEDIDLIIPHQANSRLIDYAVEKTDAKREQFYLNVDKYGNTSAGSVPIALDEARQKNLVKEGDLILLVGFGGGLTWGSLLIRL